jgi:hypothetical protein
MLSQEFIRKFNLILKSPSVPFSKRERVLTPLWKGRFLRGVRQELCNNLLGQDTCRLLKNASRRLLKKI